jgi:hypothetical protein
VLPEEKIIHLLGEDPVPAVAMIPSGTTNKIDGQSLLPPSAGNTSNKPLITSSNNI